MIPKIIHYVWFGGNPLPREVRMCIESWKLRCPGYEIKEWNEGNFNINCHHFCAEAYASREWAFASDYARLKVVYDNGGIYLDTDVELLKSLDEVLDCSFWICSGQEEGMCNTGLGFGAEAGNKMLADMIRAYDDLHFDPLEKKAMACPRLNDGVIRSNGFPKSDEIVQIGETRVYPCRYFDPAAPGSGHQYLMSEDTIGIHHYANSWGTNSDVVRRRILRLLGPGRVETIKRLLRKGR